MKKLFSAFWITALFVSCQNKEKEGEKYFPVISFIQSQVTHVDTSIYPIMKITKKDNQVDTTYIKREEFRSYARDFLELPDLASDKLKDDYTEDKFFDKTLERVIINYMPKEKESEIRRQEVIIMPTESGDQVESIFIDKLSSSNNTTIQKRMSWIVNKRFKVISLIQQPNNIEKTEVLEVIWNDFPPAE